MPNWCSVDVKIVGKKKSVKEFYDLLNSILNGNIKPPAGNGFGPGWLGTIVSALGKDYNDIKCRGAFDLIDYNGIHENEVGLSYFSMFIDHAWCPPYELFNLIVDYYNNNLRIIYYASEPGCCLHESNDTDQMFFKGEWAVEVCDNNDCEEDIYDERGVVDLVNDIADGNATNIDEAINLANKYNKANDNGGDYDNYINVYKINFVQ